MFQTAERSYIAPRNVRPLKMEGMDGWEDLQLLGIGITPNIVDQMMAGVGMDALVGGQTAGSIATPQQFLQNWLPGFVNVITKARKIDDLTGILTAGKWEDEEVVQGMLELTGKSRPYGDYTDIPLASWNNAYERRTIVRFEEGLRVGKLEEARAAAASINSAETKRNAAAMALEVQRNQVGFFGFNSGINRTYGFLNEPSLPAYVTVPNGAGGSPLWSQKTYLEITADIRTAMGSLQTQSGDIIDPENTDITLAIASSRAQFLTVTSVYGNSVRKWMQETYPRLRIVSAPELDAANGGANVFYLYADQIGDTGSDDGRTFVQVVPAKFQILGVDQRAKAYVEDYSNATAGVILKRPWAVVRYTGI